MQFVLWCFYEVIGFKNDWLNDCGDEYFLEDGVMYVDGDDDLIELEVIWVYSLLLKEFFQRGNIMYKFCIIQVILLIQRNLIWIFQWKKNMILILFDRNCR